MIGFIDELGALFTFNPAPEGKPTVILARAGISFISSEQACANAEEEIPDFDFESVTSTSRAAWNDVLGRIQVDTTNVSTETIQLFYSGVSLFIPDVLTVNSFLLQIYRSHIAPADCMTFPLRLFLGFSLISP